MVLAKYILTCYSDCTLLIGCWNVTECTISVNEASDGELVSHVSNCNQCGHVTTQSSCNTARIESWIEYTNSRIKTYSITRSCIAICCCICSSNDTSVDSSTLVSISCCIAQQVCKSCINICCISACSFASTIEIGYSSTILNLKPLNIELVVLLGSIISVSILLQIIAEEVDSISILNLS